MNLLFLGDVVGSVGREMVETHIPRLRQKLNLDFVVVNGENAAHGFGITADICHSFFDVGVDCITTGNHAWDQREIISFIDKEPRLLRPLNYPKGSPGAGYTIVENARGQRLCVANVMLRLFMAPLDNPFSAVEQLLEEVRLKDNVDAILIDAHGEATSEKMIMGHFCDGYASLVVGTHTHVPTADARILEGGTAYQTDAGMCGCYDSSIGMDKDIAMRRMLSAMPGERHRQAEGPGTLCGTFVEIDDSTGLAIRVEPFRMGAGLKECMPNV